MISVYKYDRFNWLTVNKKKIKSDCILATIIK